MRMTTLGLATLAAGPSGPTPQVLGGTWFDPDTIPVSRIVEEWRAYAGRDCAIHSPLLAREAPKGTLDREELRGAVAGAVAMMNVIKSDAINFDANDPWFRGVAAAVDAITRGEVAASPELRQFISPRAVRFRGGG